MQNAVIGFPRWTDRAIFLPDGGAYQAGYPLANLGLLPLSRAARSASAAAAATRFLAVLDKPRPVRLLAMVNHNGSLDGEFRLRLYADAALSEPAIHDTGWRPFWPPVYAMETLEWEDEQWWSGQYSTEEIAGYRATRPVWLDRLYLAQAVRVEVRDPTNPDGFFQCGLFEIAQGWQVGVNFAVGAQYGFRARTQTIEALGGVKYFDRREKPRSFSGALDYLSRDEALAKGFEHQRQMDLDVPFLWMPHPDDDLHSLRRTILVRNADLGLMSYALPVGVDSVPIRFEEVL